FVYYLRSSITLLSIFLKQYGDISIKGGKEVRIDTHSLFINALPSTVPVSLLTPQGVMYITSIPLLLHDIASNLDNFEGDLRFLRYPIFMLHSSVKRAFIIKCYTFTISLLLNLISFP